MLLAMAAGMRLGRPGNLRCPPRPVLGGRAGHARPHSPVAVRRQAGSNCCAPHSRVLPCCSKIFSSLLAGVFAGVVGITG